MNKVLFWGLIIATGLALGWVIGSWNTARDAAQRFEAIQLAATPSGGDFTLQSSNGPLSLHELQGNVVLLYFGYTFCPDICPTALAVTAQALSALEAQEIEKVRVLFVSVDPERDTLDRLKEYTAYFHPAIIGLTGSRVAVDQAVKLYGAAYRRQEVDSAGGYVVDHSSSTFVIAPDGKLLTRLPHGTSAVEVVGTIRAVLRNQSK